MVIELTGVQFGLILKSNKHAGGVCGEVCFRPKLHNTKLNYHCNTSIL